MQKRLAQRHAICTKSKSIYLAIRMLSNEDATLSPLAGRTSEVKPNSRKNANLLISGHPEDL
jgi:hypothetical protein